MLKNVVEYGQAPFWNPWYCGGNVLWQNPQIALLSPVYPLTAIMPLQLAMKVNIVLHYWIGFAGMHLLLTRVIGVRFLPAVIFLATLVTASGAPAIHLRVGHSVFLPGFYLPLQLYFFFKAFMTGEWKFIFLASATMALMVFNGGTHILPMAVAALGSFAVFAAIAQRDWRPLAFVAVFGLASVAYAAPKLLPVAEFVTGEQFWDTRNPTEKPDLVTLEILRQTYLMPTQRVGSRWPMQRHGWHEYGNYIGIGSAALLVAGLIVVLARPSTLVWRLAGADVDRAVRAIARRIQRLCARRALATPAAVLELPHSQPLHHSVLAVRRAHVRVGIPVAGATIPAERDTADAPSESCSSPSPFI